MRDLDLFWGIATALRHLSMVAHTLFSMAKEAASYGNVTGGVWGHAALFVHVEGEKVEKKSRGLGGRGEQSCCNPY